MNKPETKPPPFEKEVIRLPDGRDLTYYRFPDEAPNPAAAKRPPEPPAGKEH